MRHVTVTEEVVYYSAPRCEYWPHSQSIRAKGAAPINLGRWLDSPRGTPSVLSKPAANMLICVLAVGKCAYNSGQYWTSRHTLCRIRISVFRFPAAKPEEEGQIRLLGSDIHGPGMPLDLTRPTFLV